MIISHPKLGRLLIFDPTDEFTPCGHLRGELQDNYALLVTPDGGELTKLPQLPAAMSGVQRTARLTLSPRRTLSGDVVETRLGDSGLWQRMTLNSVTKDADRIKPIETLVSHSLSTFHLTKTTVVNWSDFKHRRTLRVKYLSMALSEPEALKKIFRIIAGDERNTAVLKPVAHCFSSPLPLARLFLQGLNRPHGVRASEQKRGEAQRKYRVAQAGAEVLPEGRSRTGIVRREEHREHEN